MKILRLLIGLLVGFAEIAAMGVKENSHCFLLFGQPSRILKIFLSALKT